MSDNELGLLPKRAQVNAWMAEAGWQNSAIRQADLDKVERVVRAAVAAERERCAALCRKLHSLDGSSAVLNAWGRDDLMAIASVRYCLGRMTYIASDCSEWLCEQWPHLRPSARAVIQRDVEEAFLRDDEARGSGDQYRPLGWDCDRAVWQKVRELWTPTVEGDWP